jgi:hypothetical protein
MTNFEATLLAITKRSKISPYEQMHKEAVRAKRARATKWNASDIESELRDAQITDKWTGLTSKTAIDFVKIGAAHGMNIAVTLGADDLFVATFEGRIFVAMTNGEKQFSQKHCEILDFLHSHGDSTRTQIRNAVRMEEAAAETAIEELRLAGLIKQVGCTNYFRAVR